MTGIFTATIIGFLIGIGRLSRNWLIAKLCTVYVEVFRNIPPLLVIFFWYLGVLSVLPQPRESVGLPFNMFLNNRGLAFPKPIFETGMIAVGIALLIAIVATIIIVRWAHKRQAATGQPFHTVWTSIALIVGMPLLVFVVSGFPLTFDVPIAGKFNLTAAPSSAPNSCRCFSPCPSIQPRSSPRSFAAAFAASQRDNPKQPVRWDCIHRA